ncbi:MAG: hypothetical protein AB7N80_07215 [Bdellovibrionales bacterium]
MLNSQDLAALAHELEILKRLLERTFEPRQRRLLHHKAFQLMRRLEEG